MHRTLTGLLALPLILLLALTGCASSETDAGGDVEMRTFTADNGEVEIPVDPQRVVATGYAVPVLIEADADLVGISTWERGLAMMSDEDRATYDGIEKISGERAADTNYEGIAELDPDLIVIGVPGPAMVDIDMERLESIAPVVAIGPTLPNSWRELSERQMDAAGRSEEYEAAKAAYEEKAEALKAKYADALEGLEFGHVGAYGDSSAGTFHREVAQSWGTNIAGDIGVNYTGEVADPVEGSGEVSEYPSLEQLPELLGDYDVVTYTLEPDGSVSAEVQYVLDSSVWKNLPAVKAGRAYGLQYTEAATYDSAQQTLDAIDQALAPLLTQ